MDEYAALLRDSRLYNKIRQLCGYVQNGTSTTVSIGQDDVTREWTIRVNKKMYSGDSLQEAIEDACRGEKISG